MVGNSNVSHPRDSSSCGPCAPGEGAGQEAQGAVLAPQALEWFGLGLCILAFRLSSLLQW